MLPEFKPQI